MEDTFENAQKNNLDREDVLNSLTKDREVSCQKGFDCSESKSKRLVRRVNSQNNLVLKVKQLTHSKTCAKDSFLRSIQVLDSWIPKRMLTIDEKYLRRCLELIHVRSSKASPCKISLNLGWRSMGILSDGLNQTGDKDICELATVNFDTALTAGTGNVIISPSEHWIVGSIMGSRSMVNILKSPLLRQYGVFDGDGDTDFRKVNFNEGKESTCDDFLNSPGGFGSSSSQKLEKEAPVPVDFKYGSETLCERFISMSSTNSTCSDLSSSPISPPVTQGMLQCTWKGGIPYFVFSLDDQKVVYVATLLKVDPIDDKALDYMYLFHARKGGRKEYEIFDNDSHLVGKMKVSTSFSLCPNNSRTMQREFVLFGSSENFVKEMQISSHEQRKNRGLSKKVMEVFRTNPTIKKRTPSRFGGSTTPLDYCSWEASQDADSNTDATGGAYYLGDSHPPNFELAAIVVKDHLPDDCQEKVGGWGLKFLKKESIKPATGTMESSVPSASCARDSGDCSTSMNVLIPAGLHGGPMTRNGGPSTLIERWRSKGCCDCGGWDLGCPLTVLKSKSSCGKLSSQAEGEEECKFVDLFIQGSKNSAPPLRMVNVYEGLYFVHFQSTLSALQSFSIAVAFIHTQSPSLQPKNVQGFK